MTGDAAANAMIDPVTGIPNRRFVEEELQARVLDITPGERIAVVALNFDALKDINRLYGYAVGNVLLQKVAIILTAAAGPEGFVARVGDDEFVVLLNYHSEDCLIAELNSMLVSFDVPIEIDNPETAVSATVGIASAPVDGTDPGVLMRRADLALYRAREHGFPQFALFERNMELAVQEQAMLGRDLRVAVKANQIIPYFQPLVHLATGEVTGYEILARWPHDERGFVPPDQFIKLAIDTGLIEELTLNLLERACREVWHWPNTPSLALNIAPAQLRQPALTQSLLRVLSDCDFSPSRLEIEITEDALIDDLDVAQMTLASLKEQGVRVAIDDFGIGYSRLQHLRELSIDALKIDKSFVQSIDDSDDALLLVKAIIQLGTTLGLAVTAEGIEAASQVTALRALGCDRGQGYYLGRPTPGADRLIDLGHLAVAGAEQHRAQIRA